MPKELNLVPTERITISATPQVVKYLQELVMKGFYGKNVAEAAERVLSQVLEARQRDETLSARAK
jgi:Arc/MetJ-type ribon-helix-helix transcriptional regulator